MAAAIKREGNAARRWSAVAAHDEHGNFSIGNSTKVAVHASMPLVAYIIFRPSLNSKKD